MKHIIDLIERVDKNKFEYELKATNSYKLYDLYQILSNDKSEKNILTLNAQRNREAEKQLKIRLQHKLISHIQKNGVKYNITDTYTKVYLDNLAKTATTKALLLTGARESSVSMAEKIIKKSIRYTQTDVTLMLATMLLFHYSTVNFDPVNIKKYRSIAEKALDLFNSEIQANFYVGELRSKSLQSKEALKSGMAIKAEEYCEKLSPLLKSDNVSYMLIRDVYQVLAIRYDIEQNHSLLLRTCDDAIERLNKLTYVPRVGIFIFDQFKIEAYIQLFRYQDADKLADKYIRNINIGTNWFALKIYKLIIRFRTKRYTEAYELLKESTSQRKYKELSISTLEVWKIYEAHIEYLVAIGKIKTSEPSTFRLHKFLNEIPLYSKDKRGLNIAILIIQFLFLLQQRKYSKIIDRAEALQLYCYRYLRKDDTFRSHCFIRMLLMMPKADFNRIRTERYAEPYLKKLKSVPLKVSQQTIEVEVIPYEDLWEMSLELLD